MIKVRAHKGRSGASVYGWRVYRESVLNGARVIKIQLGKYRAKEEAERAAEHYRSKELK